MASPVWYRYDIPMLLHPSASFFCLFVVRNLFDRDDWHGMPLACKFGPFVSVLSLFIVSYVAIVMDSFDSFVLCRAWVSRCRHWCKL